MNSITVTPPSTLSINKCIPLGLMELDLPNLFMAQSSSSKGSIPCCRPFHRSHGPGLLKTIRGKDLEYLVLFCILCHKSTTFFPSLFLLFFAFLIRFNSRPALAFQTPYLHNQAVSLYATLSSSPCFHLLYAHFFAGVLSSTTCSPMQVFHYLYLISCLSDWTILEWMKKTAAEKQAEAVVRTTQLPKTPFVSL